MVLTGKPFIEALRAIQEGSVPIQTPSPAKVRLPRRLVTYDIVPCVPPMSSWYWLTETRGLSLNAAATCWTAGPGTVAFEYPSGWFKVRGCLNKKQQFISGKCIPELYVVPGVGTERAVVCEGEVDALSIASVCDVTAFSVPNGSGTRITDGLLEPLKAYARIIIATDRDITGQGLASRLCSKLGLGRCQVVTFGDHKDANSCLQAGQTALIRDIVLNS